MHTTVFSLTDRDVRRSVMVRQLGKVTQEDVGLFRQLKQQHALVANLVNQVLVSEVGVRMDLIKQIRLELLAHARAEEETLYEALERVAPLRTEVVSNVREHQMMEEYLDKLGMLPPTSPTWEEAFADLVELFERHATEEESEMFPTAKKLLSDAQVEDLGDRFTTLWARERKTLQVE